MPLKGPKETLIWMMSSPDASDCSMRSTSRQAVSVTKLCKRATRTQIREDSCKIWNVRLKASRFNGQKCGEKSHAWRKWMNLGHARPVNNKRNSKDSTLKFHELKPASLTLSNFLMLEVPTWETNSLHWKMQSAKTTEYAKQMQSLVPIMLDSEETMKELQLKTTI